MTLPPPIVGRAVDDSCVLIVGGTSGTGLATALQFATSGARKIALVGRDAGRGAAACENIRSHVPLAEVAFFAADATRLSEAQAAVGQALGWLERIDVLVNTTLASFTPQLFHDTAPHDIQPIIFERLMAPLLACRFALPSMRAARSGVIVNVASDAAKVATPGESVIATAMAGLVMFSRTLAMEAKRDGVRVNVVTPSLIGGTQAAERHLQGGFSARIFERVASRAHLGLAQPDDVAALIVFLASPAAVRVTGQTISVNGGISAA